jgi:hypothetical protein
MAFPSSRRSACVRYCSLGGVLIGLSALPFLGGTTPVPGAPRPADFAHGVTFGEAQLEEARTRYAPDNWDSVYRYALALCYLREYHTLQVTLGARCQALPETDLRAEELRSSLDLAARLARTGEQKRLTRVLDQRAFGGLGEAFAADE